METKRHKTKGRLLLRSDTDCEREHLNREWGKNRWFMPGLLHFVAASPVEHTHTHTRAGLAVSGTVYRAITHPTKVVKITSTFASREK